MPPERGALVLGAAGRGRLVGRHPRAGGPRPRRPWSWSCWSATASSCIPGYFFDFPREAYLVVSLLPEPDAFAEGIARLFARVEPRA